MVETLGPEKPSRSSSLVLSSGSRFGGLDGERFLVEDLAGRGAQAQVYRVRDTRLERLVAAKVCLAPEPRYRQHYQRRFERELRLGSRIQHANVLAVYDCGELSDGSPYMIQEWVDRGTLTGLVAMLRALDRRLPQDYVLDYAFSLAHGLDAIHRCDVLHRDIKPDNLLLGMSGVVKIGDFGLAKDLSEKAEALTSVGSILGTNGFMSPEQLAGLPGPQSDYFSLGITLGFLLCGDVLPQGVRNGHPDGVVREDGFQQVPIWWRQQLRRLCAPHPSDRPNNMEELAELLASVDPPPASPWPQARSVLPPRNSIRPRLPGENDPLKDIGGATTAEPMPVSGDGGMDAPQQVPSMSADELALSQRATAVRGGTALSTPVVRAPVAEQTVPSLVARKPTEPPQASRSVSLKGDAGKAQDDLRVATAVSLPANEDLAGEVEPAIEVGDSFPTEPEGMRRSPRLTGILLCGVAAVVVAGFLASRFLPSDEPGPTSSGPPPAASSVDSVPEQQAPPAAAVEVPALEPDLTEVPQSPAPPAGDELSVMPPGASPAGRSEESPQASGSISAPVSAAVVEEPPATSGREAGPPGQGQGCGELDLLSLGRAAALQPADETCLAALVFGRLEAPAADIQDAALILFNNRSDGWEEGVEEALNQTELRNAPNLCFASLPTAYSRSSYGEVLRRAGVVWQNLDKGYRRSLTDRELTAELACRSAVQLSLSGEPMDEGLDWCERWLDTAEALGHSTDEAEEMLAQLE